MAARSPRRTFAAPFVVTLAAVPACFVESAPPQQPRVAEATPADTREVTPTEPPAAPPPVMTNPPPPTAPPSTTPIGSKAGGGAAVPAGDQASPKTPPQTHPYDERWTVRKQGSGCLAYAKVDCPKPTTPGGPMPTCNPPAPMKIACPAGLADGQTLAVVRYAHTDSCLVDVPPPVCDPDETCNPPPPRRVACPTRR